MSELPAGRELDELVAEKVLGWTRNNSGPNDPLTGRPRPWKELPFEYVDTPHFSGSIGAAWEVVERMTAGDSDGCTMELWTGNRWWCRFTKGESARPTLPHAICLAALKAVEA